MNTLKPEYEWLSKAFPDGLPVPSSTIITGPMGAGKPIIAEGLVASWLQAGGSVIAAPLQFPDPQFAVENFKALYNLDMNDYQGRFLHIQFDHTIASIEEISNSRLKANLVKPENWDLLLNKAQNMVESSGPGLLFFATALNLPLSAPTYREQLLEKWQQMLRNNRSVSFIFAISTSMLEEKAHEVEAMADNLVDAYLAGEPKTLNFEVKRINNIPVSGGLQKAPFSAKMLDSAEKRAKQHRTAPVKQLRTI